jgi:magnesium-transporting ATPase (P-type)
MSGEISSAVEADRTKRGGSPEPGAAAGGAALAWHALDGEAVLAALDADPHGLTTAEATRRLAIHGPNAVRSAPQRSAFWRFLAQFHNVLIYVLLASSVITALLGHAVDTVVILLVVVLNALVGFIQEGRAERALAAISGMIAPRADVLRHGLRVSIPAAEVVPGDILILESGSRVAADARLLKARNLKVDEAVLTGESVPVQKSVEPVAADALLGDRRSMAHSGTLVTAGAGLGVVTATGPRSELGRISTLVAGVQELETPLLRQMNAFAGQLTIAILSLAAATFAFAVWVRDYAWAEAFMVVVGLAVAAIPEGLPAVMTITLAIGVQRMAARNAITRRLPAVETLGSVSVICTDKTGTLTRNEMTVTRVVLASGDYAVSGVGYRPEGGFSLAGVEVDAQADVGLRRLAQSALLCNDAALDDGGGGSWRIHGDPMEAALIVLAVKAGFDHVKLKRSLPRIDEIPFDAEHRYMATLHHDHQGNHFACVKGAPERVLAMCSHQADGEGERLLDRQYWERAADRMAEAGHRVLAVASRRLPATTHELVYSDVERGLTLEGLVGLIDPPRPEAIAAVAECRSAGITVKMITGDHVGTALAIARQIGIADGGSVATGNDIDGWSDTELARQVTGIHVFARTSPEHKLRLVTALQAGGAVVAMTGDGVNDAPALKRADVGVAMGSSGTEAAKEAAEMVLADDNFASIVAAVREGRTVYDNLVKVIGWTLPTNGGQTLIMLAAVLIGTVLPVTPVQILWINTVTAVALGLVLAFEPAESDIMQRPPRASDAPILSGFLVWRVVLVSVLFALGAFAIFAWALENGASEAYARTLVVNAVVVMAIFYLFSVRYLRSGSLTWQGMLGTPAVLVGLVSIVLLQLAYTYLPFMQALFDTRSVGFTDGLAAMVPGIVLFALLEVEKRLWRLWAAE